MILSLIDKIKTSSLTITAGNYLASKLNKKSGVLMLTGTVGKNESINEQLNTVLESAGIQPDYVAVQDKGLDELQNICEAEEVSFLLIQLSDSKTRTVKRHLKACRDLRIPYLFFKDSFTGFDFSKVLVPVNFLIEEIEKAQFASAFGRFCNSSIVLLQAKDYGSKAAANVAKIVSVLEKFNLDFQVRQGKKDSFKIEYDAVRYASEHACGLIIASASREYGLDDLVFGPKELHIIKKATAPVMLINPRADLYVLCD